MPRPRKVWPVHAGGRGSTWSMCIVRRIDVDQGYEVVVQRVRDTPDPNELELDRELLTVRTESLHHPAWMYRRFVWPGDPAAQTPYQPLVRSREGYLHCLHRIPFYLPAQAPDPEAFDVSECGPR